MKKFLMVLGFIALLLIIYLAADFSYMLEIRGPKLDASSKAYVDANIPTIISTWSLNELEKRASKELQQDLTAQKWNVFLSSVKVLGQFETYEGCRGQAYITQSYPSPENITAEYVASAIFQNGTAEIKVKLIQKNSQWQIFKLTVDSPIFYK
jgi:hypothetical protein